ncbi:AI-2E family transporter, partial [Streptococcus oralis]
LAAASIGGNLFGLLGMIFFTPIFAVIYRLVKEFVVAKENQLD